MSTGIVPSNIYEAQNAYRRLQMNLSLDDPKTALIEIRTFLKIYPDVALACNDLGVLYHREGEKLLALACYEKANRLQPGTPDIVKNLAEFYYLELGWTDDSVIMLTELLRSHPDDCDLLIKLALIFEKTGRTQEARSLFSGALELDPSNRPVREALARLSEYIPEAQYKVQQQSEPIENPRSSSEQIKPPESEELEDILANLRATIDSALQPTQQQPLVSSDALFRKAQEHIEAGTPLKAIESLERLLALDPGNSLAHNDLGVLYIQCGDAEKACFHQEAAVRLNPQSPVYRKNLASLYYTCLGKTDEAIDLYTKLLVELPNDVETLSALAIISESNNLREQARTFIDKVLSIEPWNNDAREFLARL